MAKRRESFAKAFGSRLKGSTPKFFKKIRYIMAGTLAAGMSLLPFKEEIPQEIKALPIVLIIVGTIGTINNSLPVTKKRKKSKPIQTPIQ